MTKKQLSLNQSRTASSIVNEFHASYFGTIRHLFGQATINNNFLNNIWSFMCLVLVFCISSGILSSIVIQDVRHINSIDEIIESNLDIYGYNNSWIYYKYKYNDLDNYMRQIEPRLKFIDMNDPDMKEMFRKVGDRKAVFITDSSVATWKKFEYSQLNLEISEQKLYYTLMGHPINKVPSSIRRKLLKMYELPII